MNKEIIGYLVITARGDPIKLPITEKNGEFFALGGWDDYKNAIKYKILADKDNPYYDSEKEEYNIPTNISCRILVEGENSDYLINKNNKHGILELYELIKIGEENEKQK